MTYDDVLTSSAALLNDASKSEYTNAVQYPYLNIALSELQELFELNNIPVSQESSAVLRVPAGVTAITFEPDVPVPGVDYLPFDLVEINELFASPANQNNFIRVAKKEYLTGEQLDGSTQLSYINVWAWLSQEIRVLSCNQDNDVKLDFLKTLFPIIDAGNELETLRVINSASFLNYRTAALCAEFLAENPNRAASLNGNASMAIDRSLGISTKGKQSIVYRRRPFRAAFKRRGVLI